MARPQSRQPRPQGRNSRHHSRRARQRRPNARHQHGSLRCESANLRCQSADLRCRNQNFRCQSADLRLRNENPRPHDSTGRPHHAAFPLRGTRARSPRRSPAARNPDTRCGKKYPPRGKPTANSSSVPRSSLVPKQQERLTAGQLCCAASRSASDLPPKHSFAERGIPGLSLQRGKPRRSSSEIRKI